MIDLFTKPKKYDIDNINFNINNNDKSDNNKNNKNIKTSKIVITIKTH